jgi:cysteinyl-tRNA synthetase
MHNNFLVDRSGKLSKSVGGALLLDDLVQRGFHLLGFRMMCLQAHYRSPLEFSFDGLAAASARFKRIVIAIEGLRNRETEDPRDRPQTRPPPFSRHSSGRLLTT